MFIDIFNNLRTGARTLTLGALLFGWLGVSPSVLAAGCPGAVPVTPNDSSAPVRTLTAGSSDFYEIKTPTKGVLTVYSEGDLNTVGKLYDQDCFPVTDGENNNNGTDPNFLISKDLESGTYYVEVKGNSPSTAGDYRFRAEGDFITDKPGGNACSSATVVRSTDTEGGNLSVYDDRDFYQLTVSGIELVVQTLGATDTYGKLYDKDCFPVTDGEDNNSGGSSQFRIIKALPPDIYYIRVSGNPEDTLGAYTLQVNGVEFPQGICDDKEATISGSDGDDLIEGTVGNDVIQAFGGNDVVDGKGGGDIICGGGGGDLLVGRGGIDQLFGQKGNDVLSGGNGRDTLDGGGGVDLCDGGKSANDTAVRCETIGQVP